MIWVRMPHRHARCTYVCISSDKAAWIDSGWILKRMDCRHKVNQTTEIVGGWLADGQMRGWNNDRFIGKKKNRIFKCFNDLHSDVGVASPYKCSHKVFLSRWLDAMSPAWDMTIVVVWVHCNLSDSLVVIKGNKSKVYHQSFPL